MPGSRRFPPPWTVEETAACFIVRDANKQALVGTRRVQEVSQRSEGLAVAR
jgi:hypothetical protein